MLNKRDKKIMSDFEDKILAVESEQMEENVVPTAKEENIYAKNKILKRNFLKFLKTISKYLGSQT